MVYNSSLIIVLILCKIILSLFLLVSFCHCLSLTRNSIYSIHSSYYSIDLASCIGNILIISWLILWPAFSNALVQIQQCSSLIDIATTAWSLCVNLGFIVVLLIWLTALNWMNDLWMESFLALTGTEQFSLIYGIKWLIVSECMLFFACFWSLINFRVISTGFSLFFSFPLFFTYSFGIPFSNLLILLFSGVPIQAAQIFLKIGFLINTIEGLGQCLCCGWLFIILQLKEFLYSYFSLSDVMIGSIFYFTTGLHGFHVLFGSFGFFLTLWLILFVIHGILSSINASIYYSGCIDLISLFGLLFGLPMAIDFLCSLFLSSLFFLDHEPLLTLSIQTETSELLEQAFSYLFLYSFLYLSFFIDSTIGFSYKHFRIRIKHNHFLFDHFLSSSSYYFDLGSTLWNWIAVLGTYSIFAFSFSFSSSLYSWQSCCYVPFYLFDINRFLLSINNELRFKELPKFLEGVNFYFQYWIYFFYFPSFLIEFSMSFFLVSYYWHFVDWIWFLVFLFFLLFNVPNMISLLEFNLKR